MEIIDFNFESIAEIKFLNAGRRPNQFYPDTVPVFHARVDQLSKELDAVIVTADLQGRELFPAGQHGPAQGLRLLGDVMPEKLVPCLDRLKVNSGDRVGAILAGDFYTCPDLKGRGGTGDVTSVWQAFADEYRWVVGVAGNHDTFGESGKPFSRTNAHFLDGNRTEVDGIRFAGISGVVGSPRKNFRRTHENFVYELDEILQVQTDIAVRHDGPDAPAESGCRGIEDVRKVVDRRRPGLVVRGHCHWPMPFVELSCGVQDLNVDATVAILTR